MKRKLEFILVLRFGKILNLWGHYSSFLHSSWRIHLLLVEALHRYVTGASNKNKIMVKVCSCIWRDSQFTTTP